MVDESTEVPFDASFDENETSPDDLFREAFEGVENCRKRLDRMRPGIDVSTSTPAVKNTRALAAQGEGSREVRVHRGWTFGGTPTFPGTPKLKTKGLY